MSSHLNDSIAILDNYKEFLTQREYDIILSTIRNFSIENLYLDENDIVKVVEIVKNLENRF